MFAVCAMKCIRVCVASAAHIAANHILEMTGKEADYQIAHRLLLGPRGVCLEQKGQNVA